MTAILAHGVPDTEHVWHAVIARLGRDDVVTLCLPGFGGPACRRPDLVRTWMAGAAPLDAPVAAARMDDTMKRLVLWDERDPYAAPTWGERLACRTGARFVSLPECSHWWPLERPAEVAALLTRHR